MTGQRGRVVRASALKSGGRGFKSRSEPAGVGSSPRSFL